MSTETSRKSSAPQPGPAMRVLHLFSNCKWTGPAEPALNLCLGLRKLGVDADFACAPDAGNSTNMVVETARARGIEPILQFHLFKHPDFFHTIVDRRNLERFLRASPYDLLHCHLLNDHNIALRPARRLGVPLVRSSYEGAGFPVNWRHRALLAKCDCLLEPSRLALEHDARAFHFPRERMRVIHGAVDTSRFDPVRELPGMRARWGIGPEQFVFGIVARMQTHRNYDVLFEALHRVSSTYPEARLVVIGRGTYQERVAYRPVESLGLQDRVTFTGYISGDDYVGALSSFDAGIFLVPGSDGTCRAVREIMAMGKPMIVARRGMLPEIAEHERHGLVFDGSVDGLAAAMTRFVKDRAETAALGNAAGAHARAHYSLEAQARSVLTVYEEVLRSKI